LEGFTGQKFLADPFVNARELPQSVSERGKGAAPASLGSPYTAKEWHLDTR
jgi:hypothetical protein